MVAPTPRLLQYDFCCPATKNAQKVVVPKVHSGIPVDTLEYNYLLSKVGDPTNAVSASHREV